MGDPILYLVGQYPSTSETFIESEIVGLRQHGLDIVVRALERCPRRDGLGYLALHACLARALVRDLRENPGLCTSGRAVSAVARAAGIASSGPSFRHIHAHFLGLPATVAYCLSKMTGVSYSLTAHARDIYVERTPCVVLAEATFRTTCTRTGLDYLARTFPDHPFHLVRHGIDLTRSSHARSYATAVPCRLLAVGRLVEKKGFIHLLQACGLLKERRYAFRCTVVGEGPEREALEAEVRRGHLEDEVRFAGALPHGEVLRHYGEADLLLVPSITASDGDRDGVPNVLIEAMATGLPVIATDAGAIREIIEPGVTGELVAQRSAEALADAVATLGSDAERRRALALRARTFVATHYDRDRCLAPLLRLLRAATAPDPRDAERIGAREPAGPYTTTSAGRPAEHNSGKGLRT